MNVNDLILLVVVFGSIAVAVLFPHVGSIFQPLILYLMMFLLFLSFLTIDFRALLDRSMSALLRLTALVVVKLIVLPAVLYAVCLVILPDYAVPVLLLSGISTGVVAPFIANILDADMSQVLRMVVVTSLIVPISLPCMVKVLAGAEILIPLDIMVRLLAIVVFIPIVAVLLVKRFAAGIIDTLVAGRFPISLVLFALINFGVFSKYSSFFFQQPRQLLVSVGVAYALGVIYYVAGFLITPGWGLSQRVATAVSLGVMNNVLVIVFSSRFFGPLSPTLAAMYMFPFFTMIVPLRLAINHYRLVARRKSEAAAGADGEIAVVHEARAKD
jgi:bile acid:Na+ symporter, BASS family